jgi:hypothetical protein
MQAKIGIVKLKRNRIHFGRPFDELSQLNPPASTHDTLF